MRFIRLLIVTALSVPLTAIALPMEDMPLVGQETYRHLLLAIYDARLYAPEGEYRHFDTLPFILELKYRRDIKAGQILEASRRQMQRISTSDTQRLDSWMASLENIIPDVEKGDTISLHVDNNGHSHFTVNGSAAGSITDTDFSRVFSAIWLSDDSSDPAFTSRLLGQQGD